MLKNNSLTDKFLSVVVVVVALVIVYCILVTNTFIQQLFGWTTPMSSYTERSSALFTVVDKIYLPTSKIYIGSLFVYETKGYYVKLHNPTLSVEIMVDSESMYNSLDYGSGINLSYISVYKDGKLCSYKFPDIACLDITYLT